MEVEELSGPQSIRINEPYRFISISEGGIYSCRGRRGDPVFYTESSNKVSVRKTVSIKPTVTLQHNWSPIFRGETVTLRCEIHGGGGTEWTYEWRPTSRNSETFNESRTIRADSDSYSCRGRRNYELTQWSDSFSLTVAEKPRAKLTAEETIIPAWGSITLTCSVPSSAGWKFYWFRQESLYHAAQSIRINEPDRFIRVSEGGIYSCIGGRGDPVFYTESSNKVSVRKT
ncbi:PREDICTED: uncharacterized protein LOC107105016, partial [Cyprinodon variegatus]|uniref:uncharacterized protein LOC107105016 n=1 Tax=Cyprinodon variegatus TaxID=28743 RepID=UPI000742AFCF